MESCRNEFLKDRKPKIEDRSGKTITNSPFEGGQRDANYRRQTTLNIYISF